MGELVDLNLRQYPTLKAGSHLIDGTVLQLPPPSVVSVAGAAGAPRRVPLMSKAVAPLAADDSDESDSAVEDVLGTIAAAQDGDGWRSLLRPRVRSESKHLAKSSRRAGSYLGRAHARAPSGELRAEPTGHGGDSDATLAVRADVGIAAR